MLKSIVSKIIDFINWIKETAEDSGGNASSKRVIAYLCVFRLFINGLSDNQFFTVALLVAACLGLTLGETNRRFGPKE